MIRRENITKKNMKNQKNFPQEKEVKVFNLVSQIIKREDQATSQVD